ncbi:MAG: hypothetical protein PHI55_11940 [Burkholderiaceae bacterium]|nr:hypothetical protein [Burkholderiaceae bacterium]
MPQEFFNSFVDFDQGFQLKFFPHFYSEAPINKKAGIPPTDRHAKPVGEIQVSRKRVIHVQKAFHRAAHFSGTFLLTEQAAGEMPNAGEHLVEVYCLWFGHRLQTRGPIIKVNMGSATIDNDYSGMVVRNIERPR